MTLCIREEKKRRTLNTYHRKGTTSIQELDMIRLGQYWLEKYETCAMTNNKNGVTRKFQLKNWINDDSNTSNSMNYSKTVVFKHKDRILDFQEPVEWCVQVHWNLINRSFSRLCSSLESVEIQQMMLMALGPAAVSVETRTMIMMNWFLVVFH